MADAKFYLLAGVHHGKDGVKTKAGEFTPTVSDDLIAIFPGRFVSEAAGDALEVIIAAKALALLNHQLHIAPPMVSAGQEQATTVAVGITTAAVANDPDNDALTYLWTKLSGTGDVTFDDDAALANDVSFSAADTYILSLAVTDGTLTTHSTVKIVVSA